MRIMKRGAAEVHRTGLERHGLGRLDQLRLT